MSHAEQIGLYQLEQSDALPKLGRDSLLLGRFATLRRGMRVMDLGCGVGPLALVLATRAEGLTLDGIDCQSGCVELARRNLSANDLPGEVRLCRVEQVPEQYPANGYDLVVANPPYFQNGSGLAAKGGRGIARTDDGEGFRPWCRAAKWLLHSGGRFALCCRPDRLTELMWELRNCDLEPKRLQTVQSHPDKPANLILLEAVDNARPGLELLPMILTR